jgi:3-phenylpropionate/cinnamic acid dioxygenase small subunit
VTPLDALERRISELEDRLAIQGLLDGYAATLDARDWAGFEACFTDDAVTSYSWGSFETSAELGRAIVGVLEPFSVTEHIIANVQIELDGDRARSHAKLWVICVAPEDPPGEHLVEGGSYECEYRRGPDGWRIQRLTLTLDWAINGEPL